LFVCLFVRLFCLFVCLFVACLFHRGNVTSTALSWECDIHRIIVGM
jgi:hypothetical protein